MRYVSLHTHTTYSYMDGYGLPEAHVERVAELGMKAVAFTEHGNVSSHVKLELAGLKHSVKPIFGLEAYCAPSDMREKANQRKWHMTLLAMDLKGYQNLMEMVTVSWNRDFYRWPTVLGQNFVDNSAGIIATSGCADSHLACTLLGGKGILEGDYDAAVRVMLGYKRMLGDRYYLEVQRFPGLERTRTLNRQYAAWSKEFGIPLVATSAVHYPRPEQNEMQKILHAAGRGNGTVAEAEAGWEYDILLTYPLSDDEILNDLIKTGLTRGEAQQAIINTEEIADRCNVVLPKMDRIRYPGTAADLAPWPARKISRELPR
jgi:DNA polymerase-3 subunit alpha